MIHWVAWFGCNELTIFASNKLMRFESKMNSTQHVSLSVLLLGYQFSLGEAGAIFKDSTYTFTNLLSLSMSRKIFFCHGQLSNTFEIFQYKSQISSYSAV